MFHHICLSPPVRLWILEARNCICPGPHRGQGSETSKEQRVLGCVHPRQRLQNQQECSFPELSFWEGEGPDADLYQPWALRVKNERGSTTLWMIFSSCQYPPPLSFVWMWASLADALNVSFIYVLHDQCWEMGLGQRISGAEDLLPDSSQACPQPSGTFCPSESQDCSSRAATWQNPPDCGWFPLVADHSPVLGYPGPEPQEF